jgi:alpha-mannosidase
VNLEIDTILIALLQNPERTFNFVEQAFFQIWWEQASDLSKSQMRNMVASGQMQFTNGGWCMHDESSPSYVDMIDQTSLGHRLIIQEFGVGALPRITVQHDPFGHSSTQANLLSSQLAGFEGVFFGRIDYQDRNLRNNLTTLETIWRASSSTGSSGQTWLTHILATVHLIFYALMN